MLKIDLSRQAEKFLRRLPAKPRQQLARKLAELRDDPHPPDSQQLRGHPYLRADQGE